MDETYRLGGASEKGPQSFPTAGLKTMRVPADDASVGNLSYRSPTDDRKKERIRSVDGCPSWSVNKELVGLTFGEASVLSCGSFC